MIPLFNEEKPVVREEVTEEEKHLSPIKRLLKRYGIFVDTQIEIWF